MPTSAGQRRGLADRAAGVGRRRAKAQVGGDGSGGAARRAARDQLVALALAPPRRDDGAEGARLVRGAHGELVAVELAEHDGAGVPQVGADGRFIGRREVVEDLRAGGGAHTRRAEQILVAERQPFEGARIARLQALVALLRLRQRQLRRRQHVGVERGVAGLDRVDEGAASARSPKRPSCAACRALRRGSASSVPSRRTHSTTLGTTK